MPVRTGKLFKQCIKCQEMYEPHTKKAGLCPKCNPKTSFLHKLYLEAESRKHLEQIRLSKLRKRYNE